MKFENWNEVVELKKRYDNRIREIESLNDLLNRINEGASSVIGLYVNGNEATIRSVDIAKVVIDIRLREIESEIDDITDKLKEL